MRLILGGYANGRTAYAMQKYQLTAQDCFDAAQQPLTDWQGQRLILHVESLAARWLTGEKDPGEEIQSWLEKWKDAVVISQEVGCGLVPVEPEQRRFREAVGRLNCLLAESAETVERVCCGLGMQLK